MISYQDIKLIKFIKKHPRLLGLAKYLKSQIYKEEIKAEALTYNKWIENIEPKKWEIVNKKDEKPLISIVVPTYNTPDKYIIPLLESINRQTYSNWQLCISDASTDADRKDRIYELTKNNKKIKYHYAKGLHISDNTNEGFKLASGYFIGLLDHDDTLSPHALEEIIVAYNKNKDVELIYSDEDKISDDGRERKLPFFKPDWSPDLLLGVNYITHFLVVKNNLVKAVGGLKSKFDGAQDYDFLLRLTDTKRNIVHIPKILYHWRLADGSTSKSVGEKNYADNAGQMALKEAVERRNIKAEVIEIPERPTNYRLRYILPTKKPKVSIIIPFKDKPDFLKRCVNSILDKTIYDNFEIVLISNNSIETETDDLLKGFRDDKVKIFEWNHPFNYSKINNYGVSKSSGDYIVLLNNDTEVITSTWLDELIGVASQPKIGAVGPMLLYPDKKNGIQHAGVILGMNTMAGHVFRHRQPDEWTDFGLPVWPRNYLAVTGACLVVARRLYNKVGGLDETFTIAGNDVAFCLRLHESGYRNIYWPFAMLYHYESISVGSYNNGIQLDYDHSLKYYRPYLESGDQFFNPNLSLNSEQIEIGDSYE